MNVNEEGQAAGSLTCEAQIQAGVLVVEEILVEEIEVEVEVPHEDDDHQDHAHTVEILVNERPVRMEAGHSTGLGIKEAAIAQAVAIELDFVLSEELGAGRTKIIGNEDRVSIHPHAKFHAVAPDDNS
jgi:hypothetical protein